MQRLRTLGGTPEEELYDAAARGDERDLQESVLQKDSLLLDRVSYSCSNKTPLHVATIYGHLPFVKAILKHNPDLAQELDSQQSSAIHLASAKGYLEICRELLLAAPDMCLSRDCQGRNPLHLAAMKGHVGVLAELVRMAPFAARAKLDGGMTVLHLCVQYRQSEAFAILLHSLNELVNAKDDHGDTVLHMVVRDRLIEAIKILLSIASLEVNALNLNGMTALDILVRSKRDLRDSEIEESLKSAGGCKALEANYMEKLHKAMHDEWVDKTSSALMVVASLIATMAFQVGVNPPIGVWHNDKFDSHIVGLSILQRNNPGWFNLQFSTVNTTGFIASLSIILLLMSGLPLRRRFFKWVLVVITWVAITAIAFVYTHSVLFLSTTTMTQN